MDLLRCTDLLFLDILHVLPVNSNCVEGRPGVVENYFARLR